MNARLRKLVLDRDEGNCVRCGHHCLNEPHSVHHRRVKGMGGSTTADTVTNLILLCGSGSTGCHGYVHGHPAVSYRLGFLVRQGSDPATSPVWFAGRGWALLGPAGEITTTIEDTEEITA